MFTATKSATVEASLQHTWSLLTEPEHLRRWFADADRVEAGQSFRFDFGDGDAFEGRVVRMEPPHLLQLTWRFLGIGPPYDIVVRLSERAAQRTQVTVMDRGSTSREEAAGLEEGWEDFLSRLVRYARSGGSERYDWSRAIGMGAVLGGASGSLREFDDPEWWRATFPDARAMRDERDGECRITLREEGWGEVSTRATVSTKELSGGTYVGVVHEGWPELPPRLQFATRRRYAGLWLEALRRLERKYA